MAIIAIALCILAVLSYFFLSGPIRLVIVLVCSVAALVLGILSLKRWGARRKLSIIAITLASIVLLALISLFVFLANYWS